MEFVGGRLVSVSNNSGHYKLSFKAMLKALPNIFEIACNHDLYFQDHSCFWQTNNIRGIVNYNINTLIAFSDWGDINLAQQQCEAAHDAYVLMLSSKASHEPGSRSSPILEGYSLYLDEDKNKKIVAEEQDDIKSNFFSNPKLNNA